MSDHEKWRTIPDFPSYEISDWGNIYNRRRRRMMRISHTRRGHAKITLTNGLGLRHTRSVALLVAEAFVTPPNYLCDHVMILNGENSDVRASNLVWRPRGFTRRYFIQIHTHQSLNYKNLPVRNVQTGQEYSCIMDLGIQEGLLFDDIWRSTYSGNNVFPIDNSFEIFQ